MGLRSPQEMQTTKIRPQASGRIQGIAPAPIDKTFLHTASSLLNAREEEKKKLRAQQLEDMKIKEENAADADVINAKGMLAEVSGLDTLKKTEEIKVKLRKSFDDRRAKVPEQFHSYVDQIYAKKMNRYNTFAVPYTVGQVRKVKDEERSTYAKNAMDEATEVSGDPYEFNTALAKTEAALAGKAQREFGNHPEAESLIKNAIEVGVSANVREAVRQQAAVGRIDNAEQLLKNHDHELTADDRVKTLKLLQSSKDSFETLNAVRNAEKAAELDDPAEAEAYIRGAVTSDKGYSAGMAALRSIKKAQKDHDKHFDGKAVSAIFADLEKGDALDPHKLNAIKDPAIKNKIISDINSYGGIANRVTDKGVYKSLVSKMFNNRDAFKAENLEQYQVMLAPDDYKFLVKKQQGFSEDDVKRQDKIDHSTDKMIQDIAKDHVRAALDSGEIDDKQTTDLYLNMMEFQDRLVRSSKGMSERDIRRVFAERVSKFKFNEEKSSSITNLWGLMPWGYENAPNTYIPVHDHTEEEIERVKDKTDWPTEKVLKFLDKMKTR